MVCFDLCRVQFLSFYFVTTIINLCFLSFIGDGILAAFAVHLGYVNTRRNSEIGATAAPIVTLLLLFLAGFGHEFRRKRSNWFLC